MTSLYIKDQEANDLVVELATSRGISKTDAVKLAVRERLARDRAAAPAAPKRSARQIIEQFWRDHPLPPPTGFKADKAFYDDLSGDL